MLQLVAVVPRLTQMRSSPNKNKGLCEAKRHGDETFCIDMESQIRFKREGT